MLARLALLFVLVPLVELALLIQIGQVVGLLPTILLVFLTGVLGAALARREGLRTLADLQRELGQGRLPGQALMNGLAVLVGGAFLLTPGILTDVAGFLLLLPPSRKWLQGRVRRRLERAIADGTIRVEVSGRAVAEGWPGFGFGAGAPDRGDTGTAGLDPSKEIEVPGDGPPGT
ncbi:MAG TPA: FxsA family protein [Longimicrobiales bacterium]|nr:FxsA family protein [Longimicrobiales bacterium]